MTREIIIIVKLFLCQYSLGPGHYHLRAKRYLEIIPGKHATDLGERATN